MPAPTKTITFLSAGLALLLAFGCGKSRGKAGQGQKVEVTRGDIREVVQASGNVEPLNKVAILPPVTGRIDKILVYEGSYVKKGDILAWMSTSDRAALLDTARSQGEAEVQKWEEAYKATPIIAPAQGLIIARNIVAGQTVAGDTDTYDLSDRLIVLASVDETDLGKVHMGQLADCTVDAYPNSPFKAAVTLIGHQAVKVNNVVSYYVNLEPKKEPGELRAGMTANINFVIQEKKDVLILPNYALKGQTDGVAMVKVVGSDPKAAVETRKVTLGITDGAHIEIVDGLDEGDMVLVPNLNLPNAAGGGPMAFGGGQKPSGGGGGGGGKRQ